MSERFMNENENPIIEKRGSPLPWILRIICLVLCVALFVAVFTLPSGNEKGASPEPE